MKINPVFILLLLLLVFSSIGCISSEQDYSKTGSLNVYYPNSYGDYLVPDLATLVQESNIIVEVVVIDMNKRQVISNDHGDVGGISEVIQDADYTMQVNNILKTDQNIGEIFLNIEGIRPDLNIGDNAILFITINSDSNSITTPSGIFVQDGDIYKGLYHQISFNDLKTFIQKPDNYLEMYHNASIYYDIVVAQMLTNTDLSQVEYNQTTDVLPHQIHKIEVIHSASNQLTGNTEFDYRIWYFTEKMIQENNLNESFDFSNWTKTNDGYYYPNIWNSKTSFLKEGDYYIIYLYKEYSFYYPETGIIGSYSLKHIEKYDLESQKKSKELIEEYRELYELIEKYENKP